MRERVWYISHCTVIQHSQQMWISKVGANQVLLHSLRRSRLAQRHHHNMMWFSRPTGTVGCEEQVCDAKCTRPSVTCWGSGTQTMWTFGEGCSLMGLAPKITSRSAKNIHQSQYQPHRHNNLQPLDRTTHTSSGLGFIVDTVLEDVSLAWPDSWD